MLKHENSYISEKLINIQLLEYSVVEDSATVMNKRGRGCKRIFFLTPRERK